jgi:hypothetical protein
MDGEERSEKNLKFDREMIAADNALREVAKEHGFEDDDEPGRWLINDKGCRVIFNLAGGRGFGICGEMAIPAR